MIVELGNSTNFAYRLTAAFLRRYTGPVDEDFAAQLVSGAPKTYMWDAFAGFNLDLRSAFAEQDGWKLLDVYSPTILRPDSHIGKVIVCIIAYPVLPIIGSHCCIICY